MAWWENNFLKGKTGKIYIEQKEAIKIAKERGTPLFLYSKTQILSNFYNLLELFRINKSYGNVFACVNAGTFNTAPRPAIYTQAQHHILNCSPAQPAIPFLDYPAMICPIT